MAPYNYFPVFILTMAAISLLFSMQYLSSNDYSLQERGFHNIVPTAIVCIILIYWLGMRPLSASFGDTISYSRVYALIQDSDEANFSFSSEWLWDWIMYKCHDMGFTVHVFFTIIEFGYITSVLLAVAILMPKNVMLGMLFVLVSFSFFTFGVNGMRNGLAAHIVLLAIALYLNGQRFLCYVLFGAAFGIHRSVALPILCFFSALYVIKDPKYAIYIWLLSIVASFFSGYFFVNIFSGLGFDDRMDQYLSTEEGMAIETSTSKFRWDFLLYSSMPVIMAYTVIVKRGVTDNWYNILATTYCLCNAFWVLVIRASFTNRFAYLSWFIYPLVIAYPLIMLPVWDDQDNKTGTILIAYAVLTLGICYFTGLL